MLFYWGCINFVWKNTLVGFTCGWFINMGPRWVVIKWTCSNGNKTYIKSNLNHLEGTICVTFHVLIFSLGLLWIHCVHTYIYACINIKIQEWKKILSISWASKVSYFVCFQKWRKVWRTNGGASTLWMGMDALWMVHRSLHMCFFKIMNQTFTWIQMMMMCVLSYCWGKVYHQI
jgi:hypothetical protein